MSQEDPSTPDLERVFDTNDAVARGCAMDPELLARVWRGYVPGRSFELVLVPQEPNYVGAFD